MLYDLYVSGTEPTANGFQGTRIAIKASTQHLHDLERNGFAYMRSGNVGALVDGDIIRTHRGTYLWLEETL